MPPHVIHIHPEAPAKPPEGQPCNGCGVCCLSEPCPLGVLLSGRRHGACVALRWGSAEAIYRCGALSEPVGVLQAWLPPGLKSLGPALGRRLPTLARRWIAAGQGCDCNLVVDRSAAKEV